MSGVARESRNPDPPSADRREESDIAFGWELAKEMGRLDVGQSVAVKERAVLAVEAIEGTDRAILRAGELCRAGGFVVVKVAKPQQDMRFDVPTVGCTTIESLHAPAAASWPSRPARPSCSIRSRPWPWPIATASRSSLCPPPKNPKSEIRNPKESPIFSLPRSVGTRVKEIGNAKSEIQKRSEAD